MSTAPPGNSSDPPQHTSPQPGTLALLAASALGGVLATRMNRGPLVFAAGAAAYALLTQKKTVPAKPLPPSLPAPEPLLEEIPAQQSQVEQWLSMQLTRDEQAPVIDFSTASIAPPEPEDDYHPPSFLIEDADEFAHLTPSHDSFVGLMEPVPQPPSAPQIVEQAPVFTAPVFAAAPTSPPLPAPQIVEQAPVFTAPVFAAAPQAPPLPVPQIAEQAPVFTAPVFAAPNVSPLPAFHAPEPPLFKPAAEDAGWTLGVEPLPSLTEAPLFNPAASSMFFTAPMQQEEPEPPPFFFAPVFEGAAFPDEIQVVPAPVFEPSAAVFEPSAPEFEPIAHVPTFEPAAPLTVADLEEPPPAQHPDPVPMSEAPPPTAAPPDPVQEIAVEIAAPGEASFDPPLAAAPENPWAPEPEASVLPFPAPVPTYHTGSHVVEAEIILRPRAPMQNTVTAKSRFSPQDSVKKDFAEIFDSAPVLNSSDAPPEMPPPPRKPRSWRSWWRGD